MLKIKISTRLVILFSKYAIKVPLSKRGYLQGKNEKEVWNKYGSRCELAPLVWSTLGIVIQRRCKPLLTFDYSIVKEIKKIVPRFDIENCDLYNRTNWGLYKEKQVLLDYGINERISQMYGLNNK